MKKSWLILVMACCIFWWSCAVAVADEKEDHALQVIKKLGGKVFYYCNGCGLDVAVDLENSEVTGADLREVKHLNVKECKNLQTLNLRHTKVSDKDLKEFKEIKSLWVLDLSHTRVTDAGVKELRDIEGLGCLNLSFTAVDGSGLSGFKKLVVLDLIGTRITDNGLKELGWLTELKEINLENTGVTDHGLKELKNLQHLQYLDLGNTKVTKAGIKKLQLALPQCSIRTTVLERALEDRERGLPLMDFLDLDRGTEQTLNLVDPSWRR